MCFSADCRSTHRRSRGVLFFPLPQSAQEEMTASRSELVAGATARPQPTADAAIIAMLMLMTMLMLLIMLLMLSPS